MPEEADAIAGVTVASDMNPVHVSYPPGIKPGLTVAGEIFADFQSTSFFSFLGIALCSFSYAFSWTRSAAITHGPRDPLFMAWAPRVLSPQGPAMSQSHRNGTLSPARTP